MPMIFGASESQVGKGTLGMRFSLALPDCSTGLLAFHRALEESREAWNYD